MMRAIIIAKEEWRYWLRSRLAVATMGLTTILLVSTVVMTGQRIQTEREDRVQHQTEAESAFLAQPDRHPHRMVHYGHYLFRAPAPLAIVDPGLDSVTGQSIFLEGHRQNSAMFAETAASSDLGGLDELTPALVYQLFVPLLLVLLGHGAIARERETRSLGTLLAQGLPGTTLMTGKAIALVSVTVLFGLPLLAAIPYAAAIGETWAAAAALGLSYLLYLGVWIGLILLASALLPNRSSVLATLLAVWILLALVVPAIAVSLTARLVPGMGKIEADFSALTDLRDAGDGHNAEDPAFAQMRRDLFERHNASRPEELPVNMRGIVAEYAEEKLTKVLNLHAEARMATESRQAATLKYIGWASPVLSASNASRSLAGTDLESHHRFLREAEAVRYNFVQSLNKVHATAVGYSDDINRSGNASAEARTRVSAENWAMLDTYSFKPTSLDQRMTVAATPLAILSVWLALAALGCAAVGRRMRI